MSVVVDDSVRETPCISGTAEARDLKFWELIELGTLAKNMQIKGHVVSGARSRDLFLDSGTPLYISEMVEARDLKKLCAFRALGATRQPPTPNNPLFR